MIPIKNLILIDKKFHSLFLVKIKNAINLEQDYYNINSFKSKLMFNQYVITNISESNHE